MLFGVGWDAKAQRLTSSGCRDPHGARRPVHAVRIGVVARRARRRLRLRDGTVCVPVQGKRTPQRFSGFHPCLINQVTDQRRMCRLDRIVRKVVQLRGVTDLSLPPHIHRLIKGRREDLAGVGQYRRLGIYWLKHHSHSALHRGLIPYNRRIITDHLEGLGLSAHGQCPCQLKQAAPLPGFLWTTRARRNPTLLSRLSGALSLRYAARVEMIVVPRLAAHDAPGACQGAPPDGTGRRQYARYAWPWQKNSADALRPAAATPGRSRGPSAQ